MGLGLYQAMHPLAGEICLNLIERYVQPSAKHFVVIAKLKQPIGVGGKLMLALPFLRELAGRKFGKTIA
jgi:hypothetical protein